MSLIGAAAIGGAAGLGAAKMGTSSAKAINDEMMDYAKNRHQYNVADLEKAGLNPLLSVTGASSAGSAPNLQNPSDAGVRAASSAANLAHMVSQVDKQRADAELVREQTRGAKITNDLEEHKKGTYEKGWDILDKGTDYILDAGQRMASSARGVLTGKGTVDNTAPHELRMAPRVPSTVKEHLSDTRPRIWDKDYSDKMKTYRYIQSLKD